MFPFIGILGAQTPVGTISLSAFTRTETDEYPVVSGVSMGIRFKRQGTSASLVNGLEGGFPAVPNWLVPQPQPVDVGDRFEIRVVKTGGTGTLVGMVSGTWYTLNTSRSGEISYSGGVGQTTWLGDVTIREIAYPANTVTAAFNLTAKLVPGG